MIPFSSILRSTVLTNPYNKVMVFFFMVNSEKNKYNDAYNFNVIVPYVQLPRNISNKKLHAYTKNNIFPSALVVKQVQIGHFH